MKQLVYSERVHSIEELTNQVQLARAQIRDDTASFPRVRDSPHRRVQACIFTSIAKTITLAPNNYNWTAIKPNYKWENYNRNHGRHFE
jgi:hypothetical protein